MNNQWVDNEALSFYTTTTVTFLICSLLYDLESIHKFCSHPHSSSSLLSRTPAPLTLPPPSSPPTPPSPPPTAASLSPSPSPRPCCRPCRGRKWALDPATCECRCTIGAESCSQKGRRLNPQRCRSVCTQQKPMNIIWSLNMQVCYGCSLKWICLFLIQSIFPFFSSVVAAINVMHGSKNT